MVIHIGDVPTEAASAIERAAYAVGRVAATAQDTSDVVTETLLRRHAVLAFAGGSQLAIDLILGAGSSVPAARGEHRVEGAASAGALISELEAAGLEPAVPPEVRDRLRDALDMDISRVPAIVRAAVVAGVIVAHAPASADSQRAAALAAALTLGGAGLTDAPWLSVWQLDAAARSSAVQVQRSGAWMDWLRAWCSLLARDAASTERAIRAALARIERERADARAQARVGTTDDVVLAYVHSRTTFTIRDAAAALELTTPTVGTSIDRLEAMGFAAELTGQLRDRVWTASALLELSSAR